MYCNNFYFGRADSLVTVVFMGSFSLQVYSVIAFYCHIGDNSPLPSDILVTVHYKLISLECVERDYITYVLSNVDSFMWLKESEKLMNYLALFFFCKIIIPFSLVS